MEDSELQAIRAARLREMQKTSGASNVSNGLASVLEPAARERLERVRMVKPERAAKVEQHLANVYRGGKITEADIISLLGQLDQQQRGPTITFQRRETAVEDDADEDDDFFD